MPQKSPAGANDQIVNAVSKHSNSGSRNPASLPLQTYQPQPECLYSSSMTTTLRTLESQQGTRRIPKVGHSSQGQNLPKKDLLNMQTFSNLACYEQRSTFMNWELRKWWETQVGWWDFQPGAPLRRGRVKFSLRGNLASLSDKCLLKYL